MSASQPPTHQRDMSIVETDRPKLSRLIGWRQVFYAVAVLSLSYLAFGPFSSLVYQILPRYDLNAKFFSGLNGLLPGLTIVLIWALIWIWKSRPEALSIVCVTVFILYFIIGLFIPQPSVRPAARRSQCRNNLKQIGLALQNYHIDYGTFPPAYIADANGKPMHSWRVLLLPYLDAKNLYEQYRFDEPWDGPNNSQLWNKIPLAYVCPSHVNPIGPDGKWQKFMTTYHAIIGPNTVWQGTTGITLDEIIDGTDNTLAIVELDQREVNWLDPREMTTDEFMQFYETSLDDEVIVHDDGTHTLFCDVHVQYLSYNASPAYWNSLFTIAADDRLPKSAMEDQTRAQRRLDRRPINWRRVAQKYSGLSFFILALFPLPWVWITPRGSRKKNQQVEIK